MPRRQLDWPNLPHSPTLPPPVTAKHRVVKFQKIRYDTPTFLCTQKLTGSPLSPQHITKKVLKANTRTKTKTEAYEQRKSETAQRVHERQSGMVATFYGGKDLWKKIGSSLK